MRPGRPSHVRKKPTCQPRPACRPGALPLARHGFGQLILSRAAALALAAAIALSASLPSARAGDFVLYEEIVNGHAYGNSSNPHDLRANHDGPLSGNSIIARNSNFTGNVYGAYAHTEDPATSIDGNSVTLRRPITSYPGSAQEVFGGYAHAAGEVTNNSVTIEYEMETGYIYGGYAKRGNATNNTATLSVGGSCIVGNVYGGKSGEGYANNNIVNIISAASFDEVFGGSSTLGDANGNSVTISGGTQAAGASVFGGRAGRNALNNTVTISGGTLPTTFVGGGSAGRGGLAANNTVTISNVALPYAVGGATAAGYGGSATDNTVNLGEGAQVMEVYGGVRAPGVGDVFSGNTLNVNAATARVSTAVANFQTINFGFSGTSTLTTIETTPSGSSASGVTINTGAHDLTLANTTITGSGSLTKAGTGTLTLSTANALAHSGPLTVSGGTLALAGEYTQAGTLTIGATDSASYGRLAVNGPATLSDGLHVDVRGTSFADGDSLSDVLTAAGGVAGTFSRVTDNSALFDFSAVYAANSVSLGVARGAVSAAQAVASSGNAMAGGAARALDHAFAANPNGALASLFVPLTDARQVSDAVSQTLPLLAGNGTQVMTNTMNNIGAAVAARQHLALSGASGVSTGSAPREWALWAKPFNTRIEQSPKDGDPGYEANTTGILIGADAAFGESVHAGVAFAYATSDSDSKSSVAPQSMETRLYELIGYGSYAFGEGTIATWRGVFGAAENQGARTINFSAVGEADSDFDSLIAGFGAGVEHSFALSPRTTLSPYANAVYNWVRNDSYRETSDSAGISPLLLAVDAQESQSLVPELGMRLDFRPNAAWGLSAHLAEGYELLDRRSSLTARYAGVSGVSFTTKGAEESAWITRCGLALTYFMDDISLRAGYDLETRDGYTNQTFSAVLRAAF